MALVGGRGSSGGADRGLSAAEAAVPGVSHLGLAFPSPQHPLGSPQPLLTSAMGEGAFWNGGEWVQVEQLLPEVSSTLSHSLSP